MPNEFLLPLARHTEMSEAAEARLEASAAPAIAWARAEEEVLQELERLQMEQR